MSHYRFSVCVPNFNYLKYLPLTCESIKTQSYTNFEILISDNQSTDGSIDYIKRFAWSQPNVKFTINSSNLGFASNLERVSALATGENLIMLSSDDMMNPGCLEAYSKFIDEIPDKETFVLGSLVHRIDSEGNITERAKPDPKYWYQSDRHEALSKVMGCDVYKVKASEMLRRSLNSMGNPYYFLTVCYPKNLSASVGGYVGGRMYNPDKWFNWRLFSRASNVYLIDLPLFSYRWHAQNQVAIETSYGHLKYLVDEYRNTIELSDEMLAVSAIDRTQSEKNFVNRIIYRHGIGEFTKGRWLKSLRIFFLGLSTFPSRTIMNRYFVPYTVLLLTTPLGAKLIRLLFNMVRRLK